MRGNVIDLAVAVVIGAAFTNIVNSVVKGVINPVVGAFGTKNLDAYASCLKGPCETNAAGEVTKGIYIQWGLVLGATLTFVATAAVVYFMMLVPMKRWQDRQAAKTPAAPVGSSPAEATEIELLKEIRDALVEQGGRGGTGRETAPAGK
ncbi:MscL family protein [Streptomyces gamaensis]|uniref:MscL family protein n=1 Tax=Streptomyces gamaensis TaxID=1763542 RepID=A0ABW0YZM3_9ACTN